MSEEWMKVAGVADVPPGGMKGLTIGDNEIALFNVGGRVCATSNLCTHAFAFLTDGWLDGPTVECPLHSGTFDVITGKATAAPAIDDIQVYPVRIVGDAIEIKLG